MFERPIINGLRIRLAEYPTFIIVVAGPRQVGKTTLVRQVIKEKEDAATFIAVDQPDQNSRDDVSTWIPGLAPNGEWLIQQWNQARTNARKSAQGYILAIDEIQKIPRWSEIVKGLWDTDRAEQLPMHVILLGSSPWLMQKGLTESLAGRYELIRLTHWSYPEMQTAFDFSLDEYIYFGGYPGSAQFIHEENRWRSYIRGSLIQPNIEKDILQMTRVDKPALLKNLFELGCHYSSQLISFNKLLGQLQDAGNTVTLAHYLNLLAQAELLVGLNKYAPQQHRQKASSPKLNVLNTALYSALSGYTFAEAIQDRSHWGRLVESAVGAHLYNNREENCQIHYWRESPHEVDFVLSDKRRTLAIEVKSGTKFIAPNGLEIFREKYKKSRTMIIGEGDTSLAEFLAYPAQHWLESST